MSISTALSNATAGLRVTGRSAEIASNNIANALTPGYSRREVALGSLVLGGWGAGVRVEGVTRAGDARTLADRRAAEAAGAEAGLLAGAAARLAAALGEPDDPGGLGARAIAFEQALELARDTPESSPARATLLDAAKSLALAFNRVSDETRAAREEADAAIARDVGTLNDTLARLEEINREIRKRDAVEAEALALRDERDRLVDHVNRIVPVRVVARAGDEVALYTTGGAVLIDGRASVLDFPASGVITADMTVGSGALGEVTLNGQTLTTGLGGGRLDGGTLGAAFRIRDVVAPGADARIDALAGDLMTRLEAVDTDAGGAGLFTDAGGAYAAASEPGLAGRLAVNAAADPDQGGALWRLRDGLGAALEGVSGDDTLLSALTDAAKAATTPPAATGVSGAFGLADLSGRVAALIQGEAALAEEAQAHRAGQLAVMEEAELAGRAVDTDVELQRLLKIEQAYAANARVIETADFLMRRLMEI